MPRSTDSRPDEERLAIAEEALAFTFKDRALLRQALTHPSCQTDRTPGHSYERLEFLGDAVLGHIIAEEAYRRFPDIPEGQLTMLKTAVVAGETLAQVARGLGLADAIFIGNEEMRATGRGLTSALENVFEALVGAICIDAGYTKARRFVLRVLGDLIDPETATGDPKSALLERAQALGLVAEFKIVDQSGPPHDRTFTSEVHIEGERKGSGSGRTKKDADMAAAREALARWRSKRRR